MPYGRKPCPAVGCPEIISTRERRCPEHSKAQEQQRGTRQQRGYDAGHDAERRRWLGIIDDGAVVYCARGCGTRIRPGDDFDLGHNDLRDQWTGPECVPCNRRAGALKRNSQRR